MSEGNCCLQVYFYKSIVQATPSKVIASPMAPLKPPWPHLPPLPGKGKEVQPGRGGGGGAHNLNSSFSTFLATQVHQKTQNIINEKIVLQSSQSFNLNILREDSSKTLPIFYENFCDFP